MNNKKVFKNQSGATMVEYVIMVTMIAMIAFAAVVTFGQVVNSSLEDSASKMP